MLDIHPTVDMKRVDGIVLQQEGSTIAAKCLEVGRVLQVDDTVDGMNT